MLLYSTVGMREKGKNAVLKICRSENDQKQIRANVGFTLVYRPHFTLRRGSYITKVFSGRVSGLPQTEIFCGLVKKFFSGLRVSVPLSALFFA